MTTPFREPTSELPEWVERYDDERYMLSENDDEAVDVVCLTVEKAEALLEVLLDICPNADDAVDSYLARTGQMAIERSRP